MSRQIATSHFIVSASKANSAEWYQSLLGGIATYQQLGERLIQQAEQAHAFRRFDQLRERALMLSNLPIRSFQAIGRYFLAIATHRQANGDSKEARRLLELVVDTAPDAYKVKATLSLGALALHRKDYDSALYFYQETIKAGKLNDASLQALKAIGVIKAIDGDHRQAVKNLEGILPVTKYAPAHIYFDILNSYAVELGEVGRKDEARHIMRYVLASPFAFAYPEWRETAEDLKSARRSSVMFAATPYNVSALPKREPDNPAATPPSRARVLNFAKLKQKMAKKAEEKQAALVLENMSLQDMWFKLIELVTDDQLDAAQMRALLKFVVNLFSTQVQPPNHPSA